MADAFLARDVDDAVRLLREQGVCYLEGVLSPPAVEACRDAALANFSEVLRRLIVQQVVRTLAAALGAARTELGTIKALHAVLIKLERPGLSDMQAYTSTNASKSNFNKWRSRVNFVLYEAEQARYAAALSSQPQP